MFTEHLHWTVTYICLLLEKYANEYYYLYFKGLGRLDNLSKIIQILFCVYRAKSPTYIYLEKYFPRGSPL